MMFHSVRSSSLIAKIHRVGLTRTMLASVTCGSDLSGQCASFSSMATQQVQTPLHTYVPPRVLVPPFQNLSKAKAKPRKIRNIQDFVDRIPAALLLRKTRNIEPGAFNDPVARLFRRTNLPSDAWKKYSLFDRNKPYTRNLISTDHETYTLLLLCWNPEKESPIHDHPCDGCWLKVLEGGIREVRYDQELNVTSEIDCHEGELSYITDNVGYHKVGNPTQQPAVTLHLYAPPFETCQCWHSDEADPSEPCEGKNINHSEYGILKAA